MALPLNVFKTQTAEITTSSVDIYTAPSGKSGIILMAQIANITNTTGSVTVSHKYSTTTTELAKDFEIPGNDSASVLTGKLVLEAGHKLSVSSSANNKFKITLSILESVNG
jgi:hypothetical protein